MNESGGATAYGPCRAEKWVCEGWKLETSLDLDAVSAICPKCSIALVEGENAGAGISAAESEAYALGATQISDSWNGGNRLGLASSHPRVATLAASGDAGQWSTAKSSYPAAEDAVTAVGGTDLLTPAMTESAASRGFQETAWSGTGSGCSSRTQALLAASDGVPRPARQRHLRRRRPHNRAVGLRQGGGRLVSGGGNEPRNAPDRGLLRGS